MEYSLEKEGEKYYLRLKGNIRMAVCPCKTPLEVHFHFNGKTIKVDEINEKQNDTG